MGLVKPRKLRALAYPAADSRLNKRGPRTISAPSQGRLSTACPLKVGWGDKLEKARKWAWQSIKLEIY